VETFEDWLILLLLSVSLPFWAAEVLF
jgi:hypothetical protein